MSSTSSAAASATSTSAAQAEVSSQSGVGLLTFLTALATSLIIFGVQLFAFIVLKNKLARIYKPKSYLVPERQRTEYPPTSPLGFLWSIYKFKDREIIKKCGLDAYFFLRYLQTLLVIFIPLGFLILPILLPINYIGGRGQDFTATANSKTDNSTTVIGLNTLAWGNVKATQTKRYWAHLLLAIQVIIWVCFVFYSELKVYIRIRQTYLTSAEHRLRASSNTILVSSIPDKWLSKEALMGLYDVFPGGIRNIWINRDYSELLDKIKERQDIVKKLESAETDLIRDAKKAQKKQAEKDAKYMKKKNKKSGSNFTAKQEKEARLARDQQEDAEAQRLAHGQGVSSGDPHQTQHTVDEAVDDAEQNPRDSDSDENRGGRFKLPIPIVGDGLAALSSGVEKGLGAVGNGLGKAGQTVMGGGKNVGHGLDNELDTFETTRGFIDIDRPKNSHDYQRYKIGYNESHNLRRYENTRPSNELDEKREEAQMADADPAPPRPSQSSTAHLQHKSASAEISRRPGSVGNDGAVDEANHKWWKFWEAPVGAFRSPTPAGYDADEAELKDQEKPGVWAKIKKLFRDEPVHTTYPLAYNPEYEEDTPGGAEWEKYLKKEDRPTHRIARFSWTPDFLPGIPLISPKVDTIYWCREQLARLNVEIETDQMEPERYPLMNSAFIQFNHQVAAHMAAQAVSHHAPKNMSPRSVEISPSGVIWENMSIKWLESWIRTAGVYAVVFGMIILWTFPVAWSASLAQLSTLADTYSWLAWLNTIPSNLLSAISGVLPAAVLAILLALVPIVLYLLAGFKGAKTQTDKDLSVQNYYFFFLFVQVFLVVSISGSAISAITKSVEDVTSVPTILAEALPTAANYFFSYMILQALSTSSGTLLQIGTLILWFIMPKIFDSTAREKWRRSTKLPNVKWGSFFPVYTNFACIALIYSVIAPLIIVFAVITFTLLWVAHRYNMLYVVRFTTDTGGLLYPQAINQTFTGLYLMELCLIGLFFSAQDENGNEACKAQAIIMIVALVLTMLYQYLLNDSFAPLFKHLPITLEDDAVVRDEAFARAQRIRLGLEEDEEENTDSHTRLNKNDDIELHDFASNGVKPTKSQKRARFDPRSTANWAKHETWKLKDKTIGRVTSTSNKKSQTRRDFAAQRRLADALYGGMADEIEDLTPDERDILLKKAFLHIAARTRRPTVWIPRDDLGVSDDEIRRTREYSEFIWISNEGTALDSKCRVVYGRNPPDFSEIDLIEL